MQASDLSPDPEIRIQQVFNIAKNSFYARPLLMEVSTTQAILESALDQPEISGLAKLNNLFGIKGEGTLGSTALETTEDMNGEEIHVTAGFAVNRNLEESFEQYRNLIFHPRYEDVVNATNIDDAFDALLSCGYATDPEYPEKLRTVYREYLETDSDRQERL